MAGTSHSVEFPFQPERTKRVSLKEFSGQHSWVDPPSRRVKVKVSIRLDQDVLEYFKQRAVMEREQSNQRAALVEPQLI